MMSKLDEYRVKHLEFIQGVINRLSTNSFLLKGWTVLIVAALLSFSLSENSRILAGFSILPLTIFWGLDGYFLWEERKYRKHYDRVRKGLESPVDFSMDVSDLVADTGGWLKATFSTTLVAFHGVILLSIVATSALELGGFKWLLGASTASITQTTPGG